MHPTDKITLTSLTLGIPPAWRVYMHSCLACWCAYVFICLACLLVLCPYVLTWFTCLLCSNILQQGRPGASGVGALIMSIGWYANSIIPMIMFDNAHSINNHAAAKNYRCNIAISKTEMNYGYVLGKLVLLL